MRSNGRLSGLLLTVFALFRPDSDSPIPHGNLPRFPGSLPDVLAPCIAKRCRASDIFASPADTDVWLEHLWYLVQYIRSLPETPSVAMWDELVPSLSMWGLFAGVRWGVFSYLRVKSPLPLECLPARSALSPD